MKKRFTLLLLLCLCSGMVYAQVPRRSLVELFVNGACVPCSSVYPQEVAELTQYDSTVSAISYAMDWPGPDNNHNDYPAGMVHRKNLYNVHSIPAARMNGLTNFIPYTAQVMTSVSMVNRLFEIRKENATSDSIVMQTKIVASQPLAPGHVLYMALTERNVRGYNGVANIPTYRHMLRYFFGVGDSLRTWLPAMAAGDSLVYEYRVKKSDIHYRKFSELAGLSFIQLGTYTASVSLPLVQSSVIQPFEAPQIQSRTKVIHPFSQAMGAFSWKINTYYPDTLVLKVQRLTAPSSWTAKLFVNGVTDTEVAIPLQGRSNQTLEVALRVSALGEENVVARYKISARYKSQSVWTDSVIGFQFMTRQSLVLLTSNSNTESATNMGAKIKSSMANAGIPFTHMHYSDLVALDPEEADTSIIPAVFIMIGGSNVGLGEPLGRILKSYLGKGGRFFVSYVGAGAAEIVSPYVGPLLQNVLGLQATISPFPDNAFTLTPAEPSGQWFTNFSEATGTLPGTSTIYVQHVLCTGAFTTPAVTFNNLANRNAMVKTEGNGFRSVFGYVSIPELYPDTSRYQLLREVYRFLFLHPVTGKASPVRDHAVARIYPVPASDYIQIVWPASENRDGLTIFDSVGKVIWQQDGKTKPGQICVSNWPKGIYHLSPAGNQKGVRFVVE